MNPTLKKSLEWIVAIILIPVIVLGLVWIVSAVNSSPTLNSIPKNVYLIFGFWLIFWIGGWAIAKYQLKAKQAIGLGWLISLPMLLFWFYAMGDRLKEKTPQELQAEAKQAGEQYFFLSQYSTDHDKICDSARDALDKYKKVNDEYFIRILEYSLKHEKCY